MYPWELQLLLTFYKKWEIISVYCYIYVKLFEFQLMKENFDCEHLPRGVAES